MKKRTLASIARQIDAAKNRIANEREKLRDLISDAEELKECCDDAHRDLEDAADALSRLV